MKVLSTIALTIFCLTNIAAQQTEIWRNPEIFAINKEAAHAEFIDFTNRAEAVKVLNLKNPWSSSCYQNLNGEWDFKWYGDFHKVPNDWYAKETNLKWDKMTVPGTWQSKGYDRLYYLNTEMPFEYDWNTGKLAKGFRDNEIEHSKATGYIPDVAQTIGCYRRWVEIPEQRLNNSVVLRIGAVEAGVQVFVNGKKVGYSQGTMTPAEFEISKYLTKGKNLIALKVFHWTDGSYMEVQDMVRFAGIYRDVFLRYEPKQHIRDIKFIGTPDKSLKTVNVSYDIKVSNDNKKKLSKAQLKFEILPAKGSKVIKTWTKEISSVSANSESKISGSLSLNNFKLWSPDKPNLYKLLISLIDKKGNTLQLTRNDIGFKRFEQINGNLFLNGKRYFIKGVNRHDHDPKYGKHVLLSDMIRDITLMKQNNINTVRTSHYPNDERWCYLCNRYGIALIDETNLECHSFQDVPGDRKQWEAAAVDRVESIIQRDKNNPAVFIWSLGNEQGWGWTSAFDAQFNRAKEIDNSRLVMCDRGNRIKKGYDAPRLDKPNTVTPMYRALRQMHNYLDHRNVDKRPFFMCEYRHAMGNAVGDLRKVWDMIYSNQNNGLNGGCIWDWIDQGVEAHSSDGRLYYQYGGDWGDKASAHNFCLNGLITPDRKRTPKLAEVKKCYEPLKVQAISVEKGEYKVLNLQNQQNLSRFEMNWELRENGKVIQTGNNKQLKASPSKSTSFNIHYDASKLKNDKEYIFRISFKLKNATKWAAKGYEITFSEFKLKGAFTYTLTKSDKTPTLKQTSNETQISTQNGVALSFNNHSGLLDSYKVNGEELLTKTKRDYLFDYNMAWIDNLYNMGKEEIRMKDYRKLKLDDIVRENKTTVNVKKQGKSVVVTVNNLFMSPENAGYTETQTWTIDGLGQLTLDELVKPVGKLTAKVWIPRIGLRIPLKPEFSQMSYYGLGPDDNYPDRCYGSWMNIFSEKVMDNYTAYPNPQDCGNHEQVRWMSITNNNGTGLKVLAPKSLSMSALPYTQDELKKARHTIDLPKKSKTTELRVAAKVTGIGNGSCGSLTESEYRTNAGVTKYKVLIVPIIMK